MKKSELRKIIREELAEARLSADDFTAAEGHKLGYTKDGIEDGNYALDKLLRSLDRYSNIKLAGGGKLSKGEEKKAISLTKQLQRELKKLHSHVSTLYNKKFR